jgi:photosystem II stability/assembly factor-like uncharacterized protein
MAKKKKSGLHFAGEGAIWAQPDGLGTKPEFLGCHELGDIAIPKGDVKLYYCPDDAIPNEYVVMDSIQSAPGPVTTSIKTDLLKMADILEDVRCKIPVYIHRVDCPPKNVFSNYYRSFGMPATWITNRGLTKMSSRDPDTQDRTEQTFDLTAEEGVDYFKFKASRIAVAETEAFTDVTACDFAACAGACGAASLACDTLYAATDTKSGSPVNKADVWKISCKGATLFNLLTDPFAGGEKIASIECIIIDKDTTRLIVARGTTDAGNPMEVAISDDSGATWSYVNVGTLNGQYAMGPNALYVLDAYHIWLACSSGYIYFSSDFGITWTAQTSGGVTAANLWAVNFYNDQIGFAVGETNAVIYTIDGGSVWTAGVGATGQGADTITDVAVLTENNVFISYNDGNLYRSDDGVSSIAGDWELRGFSGSGAGSITDMDWYSEAQGALTWNPAVGMGKMFTTIDGGWTWEAVTIDNAGLAAVHFCSPKLIYGAGNIYQGTGLLFKAIPG